MPRGPCAFKQRDVERLLRATRAAHVEVTRVEKEKDGRIILVLGKPTESQNTSTDGENKLNGNPWDEVLDGDRH